MYFVLHSCRWTLRRHEPSLTQCAEVTESQTSVSLSPFCHILLPFRFFCNINSKISKKKSDLYLPSVWVEVILFLLKPPLETFHGTASNSEKTKKSETCRRVKNAQLKDLCPCINKPKINQAIPSRAKQKHEKFFYLAVPVGKMT